MFFEIIQGTLSLFFLDAKSIKSFSKIYIFSNQIQKYIAILSFIAVKNPV